MTKKETEILLIFPDDPKNTAKAATSKEARMLLRGSGKGENLTEKLLRSRVEDFDFEKG